MHSSLEVLLTRSWRIRHITKENDYCYLSDASFECKSIVEIEFSLAKAKESNLPVPGLTREQTDDMPTLDVSAY